MAIPAGERFDLLDAAAWALTAIGAAAVVLAVAHYWQRRLDG